MTDRVQILNQSLTLEDVANVIGAAEAGGVAIFAGTTRAETSSDGRSLVALDYEAYEEMAIAQMTALATRARERWPIISLALLHRVGRVNVGEASVIIAVACPHRGQVFDACRFLIDTLKAEVAIWKKEVWSDGSTSWKGEEGS